MYHMASYSKRSLLNGSFEFLPDKFRNIQTCHFTYLICLSLYSRTIADKYKVAKLYIAVSDQYNWICGAMFTVLTSSMVSDPQSGKVKTIKLMFPASPPNTQL